MAGRFVEAGAVGGGGGGGVGEGGGVDVAVYERRGGLDVRPLGVDEDDDGDGVYALRVDV